MTETTETKRPYAGQAWARGVLRGPIVVSALEIIARDLRDDARKQGVTGDVIELWANEKTASKGFFIGDTTGLPLLGWTKVTTL